MLVTGALSVLPLLASSSVVFAQDEDMSPEGQAAVSCYEAKDWDCAFEGAIELLGTEERLASCKTDRHGCAFEMIFLYSKAIGAAQFAGSPRRREIAVRALSVLRPMSDGLIDREGELYLSALRYDACKSMSDAACVEDSSISIRLAVEHADNYLEPAEFLAMVLADTGVNYPVNLDAVMAEVAQMEFKQ